jgi:LmbE family N-acetylglucosaminyl deacetylase
MESLLILSPHTDDAELGCGGTISRLIEEGKSVWVAIFSICDDSLPSGFPPGTLKKESTESLISLGVDRDQIIYYDYKVRVFNYCRQQILEDLVILKNKISPQTVFIPSLDDYHQDHKTIAEEGVRCFKNNCSILSYELIWNNTGFKNQLYYELEERHITNKINALKNYKTQQGRAYLSEEFIKSLAKVRGIQNGVKSAEAYEVIRYKK